MFVMKGFALDSGPVWPYLLLVMAQRLMCCCCCTVAREAPGTYSGPAFVLLTL